jgi:hypothetical protein
MYGPHGLELSCIGYDFAGRSARIVATKVTGQRGFGRGGGAAYGQDGEEEEGGSN